MRRSDEEKGVRARQRGKGHMTIIGLIMNTISPRTRGAATSTLARTGAGQRSRPASCRHEEEMENSGASGATCCSPRGWGGVGVGAPTCTPQHGVTHPPPSGSKQNSSERLIYLSPRNKEYKGCEFNGNTRRGILFSFKSTRGTG